MSRRFRIVPAAVVLLVLPLLPGALGEVVHAARASQAADADAHKAWMNDASDAQEDYRFAVAEKDAKAAAEALVKLEDLMGRTEGYWAAKRSADGVRLSKDARAQAAAAASAVKAGRMADAGASFDKLGTTCNTCHELHLEKK